MKLVEQGRLDFDARAFDIVRLPPVLTKRKRPDPQLKRVTVRQLLQHTGGWDREKSFDPMFRPLVIAETVGVTPPAHPEAVIRYMMGHPLDFAPGARYAYSNFDYCVLGRIIETITGAPYEQYVQKHVLAPIGIKRMRVGASLLRKRAQGEVRYYTPHDSDSVFPERKGKVPAPYGSFHLEAMDAHGGWIASAVDLARFAAAFHDPQRCPLLKPETIETMHAPPPAPAWRSDDGTLKDAYYACGWMVRPVKDGKANYWHAGSLPGTATLLVRRWDGLSWAVLFNQRSTDPDLPDNAIDPAMHRAADAVKRWTREDLFSRYLAD
jgi:N-acyl-D-amino-acid deacylase